MNSANFVILLLVYKTLRLECTNYERFEVDEEECSKEDAGVEVKSTTECLLHCSMGKCMNSLITQNRTCFCTEEECSPLNERSRSRKTYFFSGPIRRATIKPICYETGNRTFATFKVPKSGRINYFKLVHVSVSCHYDSGFSRWGCIHMKSDKILTAITDSTNRVIVPTGSHYFGQYTVSGVNHLTDDEITLPTNSDIEVEQDQELRVWYTEDLFGYHVEDNAGTHCIHVLIKYC